MSLTKCKECGLMVSSEAKTCPHCGVKKRRSAGERAWFVFCYSILAFIIIVFLCYLPGWWQKTGKDSETLSEQAKGAEKNLTRLERMAGHPLPDVEDAKKNLVGMEKKVIPFIIETENLVELVNELADVIIATVSQRNQNVVDLLGLGYLVEFSRMGFPGAEPLPTVEEVTRCDLLKMPIVVVSTPIHGVNLGENIGDVKKRLGARKVSASENKTLEMWAIGSGDETALLGVFEDRVQFIATAINNVSQTAVTSVVQYLHEKFKIEYEIFNETDNGRAFLTNIGAPVIITMGLEKIKGGKMALNIFYSHAPLVIRCKESIRKREVEKLGLEKKLGLEEKTDTVGKLNGQKEDKKTLQQVTRANGDDDIAYDSMTEVVTRAFLPDYEQTPIGDAFNAFFANPKWEFKVAPNGVKYVIFSGRLKTPVQIESNTVIGGRYIPQTILKETLITFKFVIKPSTYRKFEIYSVDVEEDGYGRQVEMGQRQVDSFIKAIYTLDIDKMSISENKDLEKVNKTTDASKEECPELGKSYYDKWLNDKEREDLPFDKYVEAIKNYKKKTGRDNLNFYDYKDIAIDAQFITLAKRFYQERFSVGLRIDIPLEEFIFAAKEYRDRSGKVLYYMDFFNVQTKVASNNWWWNIKYLSEKYWASDMNEPATWEQIADGLERYRRINNLTIRELVSKFALGDGVEGTVRKNLKDYLPKNGDDWKSYASGYYEDYLTEDFKKHVSLAEFVEAAEAYKKRKESTSVPHLYITDLAQIRRDIWLKKYQQGVWK